MFAQSNYVEPCVCGDTLDEIQEHRAGRLVTWKCPKCQKHLASTMVSDSPVAGAYAIKALLIRSNATLREAKGLPPKPTRVTFTDEQSGEKILWKDIVARNKAWEKKVGAVQAKPF